MGWIDKNDFIEFEASILSYPVRVENTEVGAFAANTFFTDRFVGSGLLDLGEATGVAWLTVNTSFLNWSFTSTSADANSVDDETLLSLVTEFAGLVWASWSLSLVDDSKLSIFPGSDSHDKSHKIRLFLSPDFLKVLISSHLYY